MQENLFCTIKPFLSLFKINTTLLIGSGTGSYLPLLSSLGLQDVLLVEADKNQIEKMYKMHDFSKKYQIENSLIITDADIFPFYVATYKKLSGTQKLKKYKTIMPNISLLETQEIKAESLDSFTQRMDTHIEFLIIDTFTAKDILKEGIKTLENIKIILCASLLEDKDELIEEIEKKGFKKIEIFMDNNPEFVMVLFVRDYIKKFDAQVVLANSLEEELDKYKKELDLELVKKNKILEESDKEKKALEEKNKVLLTKNNTLEKDIETYRAKIVRQNEEIEAGKVALSSEKKVLENVKEELARTHKSLEVQKSLAEKQLSELNKSKFVLSQLSLETNSSELLLVAQAENSQNLGEYYESIIYWQKLAGIIGSKMPQLYYNRLAEAYEKIGGFPLGSKNEELLNGSFDKHEVLASIHSILKPNFYFEIGVQTGKSLQLAKCKAIGIDPMPRLSKPLSINMELFKYTSDTFFKYYAPNILTDIIDFVFIDGMHLFEYALRDFINVEKYMNNSSIIVIDDIYPGHVSQANRDRKTRAWTGDVWKLASILQKYRKDLNITLLNVYPTGLMVIKNLDSKNRYLEQNYDAIVSEFMDKEIDTDAYIARSAAIDSQKYLEKLKEEMR